MNNQTNPKNQKSAQMRTIYVTLALAMVVMAVLVALSGSWRRSVNESRVTGSTQDAILTLPDKQVMAPHTDSDTAENTTDAAAATDTADITSAKPSDAEPLPEFVAPVSGSLMKAHSGDTAVFSLTMNDYRPHYGVDLYASVGDDVFAAADGEIAEIWEDPMSGNCISIKHSGGAVSIYRNLAPTVPENITVGAKVSAGEVIGSVGETSLLEIAEEPHIHYELKIDDVSVNPADYIAFPAADTNYEG